MKRGALVFLSAFTCSALSALVGTGCGTDCDCPQTPPRPEPEGPLSGLQVHSFDEAGNAAELGVKPENGTMELTQDAVIIRYQQDGSDHEIRYLLTN